LTKNENPYFLFLVAENKNKIRLVSMPVVTWMSSIADYYCVSHVCDRGQFIRLLMNELLIQMYIKSLCHFCWGHLAKLYRLSSHEMVKCMDVTFVTGILLFQCINLKPRPMSYVVAVLCTGILSSNCL